MLLRKVCRAWAHSFCSHSWLWEKCAHSVATLRLASRSFSPAACTALRPSLSLLLFPPAPLASFCSEIRKAPLKCITSPQGSTGKSPRTHLKTLPWCEKQTFILGVWLREPSVHLIPMVQTFSHVFAPNPNDSYWSEAFFKRMEAAAVSEVTNPLNYLGRAAFRLGTVRLLDVFQTGWFFWKLFEFHQAVQIFFSPLLFQ